MSRSAYERLKEAQILGHLSPEEQEEVETLQARKRLYGNEPARLNELWDKAFSLHVPPQLDPLIAYADEVAVRMRERQEES